MEQLDTLLARAKDGDLEAFAAVVKRFQNMAAGYAFAILGDFHLAEDAAQAAFFEVYCNLDKVYDGVAFPAWLRKIIFKQCDRIGRKRKLTLVPIDAVAEPQAQTDHPAQAFDREETKQRVRKALLALPDQERQVAILFYLCGYSRAQIAAFVDKPLGEVIYRLRSARTQFKRRITTMNKGTADDKDRNNQIGALTLAELGIEQESPQLAQCLALLKEHSSQWNGQNLLQHSVDVAHLSAAIAGQLGWNVNLARRTGLLHDIGKIADTGANNGIPHPIEGANMVSEWGEDPDLRAAIATHHERGRRLSATCQLLVVSPLCFVVRTADAMASQLFPHTAGPDGLEEYARIIPPEEQTSRDSLEPYMHRILQLDDLTQALKGVAAAYLFCSQLSVALLLRTTAEAGEMESLAFAAAEQVKTTWNWQQRVVVTPISTKAA